MMSTPCPGLNTTWQLARIMLVFYTGLGKWILASGDEKGGQAQDSILHQIWTIPVQGAMSQELLKD